MSYFSSSYFESTARFRNAAEEAGGRVESHRHPSETGPNDEALTVDVAVFGESAAPKVFFNTNGVHGLESYPGAAAQLDLLESGALARLPDDCAAILIHNLNPFGWAYGCQRNEANVDINRNFIDFSDAPRAGKVVDKIADAIAIETMSFGALDAATANLQSLSNGETKGSFSRAIMLGQFENPNSLKYGGNKPEWSNQVLRDVASRYFIGAERVAFLDWHTGLGDYGAHFHLPFWDEGSESWDLTVAMWGEDAVRAGGNGILHGRSEADDVTGSQLYGLAISALIDAKPDAVFCGGVIELGTVPFEAIVQATILDHWLRKRIDDESPSTRYWREQVRLMFSPRDPWWEEQALSQARATYTSMLSVLA